MYEDINPTREHVEDALLNRAKMRPSASGYCENYKVR